MTGKPNPGMILRAASELRIDLANSVLIGDKESDVTAGWSAGIPRNYLLSSSRVQDAVDDESFAVISSLSEVFL